MPEIIVKLKIGKLSKVSMMIKVKTASNEV